MGSFDFRQFIHSSLEHYNSLDMHGWANEIDKNLEIELNSVEINRLIQFHDLQTGMVLPSYRFQAENGNELIASAQAKMAQLGHSFSMTDSLGSPNTNALMESDFNITERYDKPYLLLYSWKFSHPCTYGRSGEDIRRLFAQKRWTGMTSHEFIAAKLREDASVSTQPLWTWLVDSSRRGLHSVGYVDGDAVKVYACKRGSQNEKRGALVTSVIPLREVKEYRK